MTDETYLKAVALRHELHRHPELSCEERWTKQHLMDYIRANTRRIEVVDRGRWFYARYRSGGSGKKFAFRADFDALPIDETISLPYGSEIPGVAHKCGHDGHCATLCALILETDRRGSPNELYFIFQHAEETGVGAKECSVLIDEEGIDAVYGYHNESGYERGDILIRDGSMQCASEGMSLYFEGLTSHASDPGMGRNPTAAISRLALTLPKLYRTEDYTGFVMATVVQVDIGQRQFGTAASSGVLRLTIRAQYDEELDKLRKRIADMAHSLSVEYGLVLRTETCEYFPQNCNHKEDNDRIRAICARLGLPLKEFPFPKNGSEDFGWFTRKTKGAFFNVGNGPDVTAHHTVTYDFPDEIMKNAELVFEGLAELNAE